jgi:acyl-coenzyme A thioesterase PaaI-like protein
MPESWTSRITRWGFNAWPCYRGTGGRLTYVAADWREVRVRVPLSFGTRNYVGTIFGGSIYGAVDPIHMVMLIRILGPAYSVWDKSASVRFLRPGRETLYATFRIDDAELAAIHEALDATGRAVRTYDVDLVSAAGLLHAQVEKVVSIRRRVPLTPATVRNADPLATG